MRFFLFLMAMAISPAFAETLPPECRFITKHKPDNDVAYQPGVDVRGKQVVPADLNAVAPVVPDVIRVPLSVDLIERVRDNAGQFTGVLAEADLGVLEIHKDGRVFFNGQDWSGDIYAACGLGQPDALKSEPVSPEPVRRPEKSMERQGVTPVLPEPDEELFGSEYK